MPAPLQIVRTAARGNSGRGASLALATLRSAGTEIVDVIRYFPKRLRVLQEGVAAR